MEDTTKKSVSFESDPLLQCDGGIGSQRSNYDEDIFLTERSADLVQRLEEEEGPLSDSMTSSQRWRNVARILRSGSNFESILRVIAYTDREKALRHVGIGEAAFLIQEAVIGEVENPAEGAYDPYIDPTQVFRNAMSVICRRICSSRPVIQLLHGTAWLLLALTFFEPPDWCRPGRYGHVDHLQGCAAFLSAKGKPAGTLSNNVTVGGSIENGAAEVQYYPNSSSMLLTVEQSALVESIGLGIIFVLLVLRVCRDGGYIRVYLRAGKARWNRVTQIVSVLSMTVGLATGKLMLQPYFRLTLLLSFLTGVQRDIRVLIKMMFPEIIYLLGILGVLILFYAWFGCVMFVGTAEGQLYFPSLPEGMWSLYISVTTANYPDLMMPSYNENRWTALYFCSFMALTFFFVMNVILASVVNEYEIAMAEREEKRRTAATENLRKAFALLDVDKRGRIDRATVMGLFYILNEDFPEFRTLSDDETKLLFAVLDKDGTSLISEEEFMDFGNVVLLEFTRADYYASFVEKHFPEIATSPGYKRLCKFVESKFEFAIDIVLVLNAIVIAIQSAPELSGQKVEIDPHYYNGRIDTVWELVEAIFTAIYALEMILKIIVNGWRRYIAQARNAFDFVITILAVVSTAIVYYPNEFSDSRIIRMVVMARVLRLIRLLTIVPRFQMLAYIASEILPAAKTVVLVLFFLMYLFAFIGMSLYGGLISRDPQNHLSSQILSTDFADNEYWANNFNDMISGMNVLFNLLIVNNWTECEIGFEATTGSKWVRFFFVSFHILGVIMVNNLVIAFIISEFLTHRAIYRETTSKETLENNEAVLYRRVAEFDGSTVTGTTTSLSGKYYARLAHSDSLEGRDHDRLRKLFTQTTSSTKNESER